jgi:hypothetical protein
MTTGLFKNKFIYWGTIIIGCLLLYNLSIKKTITLYSQWRSTQKQIEVLDQNLQLRMQSHNFSKADSTETAFLETSSFLDAIALLVRKHGATISNIGKASIETKDGVTIQNQSIEFIGNYRQALRIMQDCKKQKTTQGLCSIAFKTYKNYSTGSIVLKFTLYYQTIIT